ncbi:hypothetical protein [Pseudomonas proteolytica]|uniref:hypothetical protein n=1 Tax=Pseudomonas proteolytica TaxID=219574 RepID=UPI0030EC579B
MMNDLIFASAKIWVELFTRNPKTTLAATAITTIILIVGGTYLIKQDQLKLEAKRLESNNYITQLSQLNNTEQNIKQLLEFVSSQKTALREAEDSLFKLRSEKERLQPLLDSDKATIEAIFKAQEDRASSSVWKERTIGFASGIVASLIASFIWYIFVILFNKRKNFSRP